MASPYLGKALVDEDFSFYGHTLAGKTAQSPRWQRCIDATTLSLGQPLGEAYVKLKFSESAKQQTLLLVENIHKTVEANFDKVEWMDPATREQAKKKLSLIFKKVGYPDKWQDYSSLHTDRTSIFENQLRANEYADRFALAKIGKASDKTEWGMAPQTVNAYYEPTMNEIVFPAAILQTPFYDASSPLAWNYGAIGMVIGHETTHAFDDEGRHFDGYGQLKDWWTEASAKAFTERADCLVKQFDGYVVSGGVHLSGRLTLGENIADLGGIKLSYAAYQTAKQGVPPSPDVAGFNEDQQFFVSFAQGWCTKETPEFEQLHAKTNPHADPRYRVNGVVVNVPEFAQVFGCKAKSPMAPENRCTIW
jgi:endothelin-converting enzyme/putative endopeptidase